MNSKKIITTSILVIILVLVFGFIYNNFVLKNNGSIVDLAKSNYDSLWSNSEYNNAEELLKSGKKKEALATFESILTEATSTDPIVLGQLQIRVATLYDADGQKDIAVKKLFEIINGPDAYFITKAFSYEYLARMLYMTKDQKVYDAIMVHMAGDQALAGLSSSNDKITALSLVLLQKSEAVTPLYLALTQRYYIETQLLSTKISTDDRRMYLDNLIQTEAMIADIEREQNVGYMLPLALLRKAQVIENIYAPGLTKQSPDIHYGLAVQAYNNSPQARGYNYVYYEYARYLAVSGGVSKKTEIDSMLAHFNQEDEKNNLKIYLQNLENDKNSKAYKDLQVLKKIAPEFKL